MRHLLMGMVLSGILLAAGCGQEAKYAFDTAGAVPRQDAGEKDKAGERGNQGGEGAKPRPRKIVYTGRVELVVEDFDAAREGLMQQLAEHEGYVARSEVSGRPGEPRRGSWTVRVPVERFEAFRETLKEIGELRRSTLDSEDITDRYFDMSAEVTNLEIREKALRKLYEEKIAASKLSDLLEVDRELTSVRGQINQRKGQLQRWDKETAYATLQIEMQDRKSYVPPTAPDFGTSIGRTFWSSIDALVRTGKALVLVGVAVAPWVGVAAVVILPVVLLARRRRRPPPVPVSGEENKV